MKVPSRHIFRAKLSRFLLKLWTRPAISVIGNSIGKFTYLDERSLCAMDKRVAWVLYEINFARGSPVEIYLLWAPTSFCQRIDFWGIPFRCLVYHQTGHVMLICLRHFKVKCMLLCRMLIDHIWYIRQMEWWRILQIQVIIIYCYHPPLILIWMILIPCLIP